MRIQKLFQGQSKSCIKNQDSKYMNFTIMTRHNLAQDYMINKPCGHHLNRFSVMDLSCSSSFDPKSKLCIVLNCNKVILHFECEIY